jgi:hypothetical protein
MEEPPGGAAFFVDAVTRENNCYILMVTGSVSVKLRADSAPRFPHLHLVPRR